MYNVVGYYLYIFVVLVISSLATNSTEHFPRVLLVPWHKMNYNYHEAFPIKGLSFNAKQEAQRRNTDWVL